MRVKEKVEEKNYKEVGSKIMKWVKIILFIAMIILIFVISPRITQVIQDTANYIYNLDSNLITRIVELALSVVLVFTVSTQLINKK